MTPDQQAFEDRCWEHYLAERARRTMPGDVEGEPTREGLFWRREDGQYGVLAFNTAWMAYQWGMQAVRGQGVPDGFWPMARRRVFDYIRGAYDLGYNDARNARTIPGDGAPGYKGRDVEADHGGALLHALEALASTPPASQAQQQGVNHGR